MKFLLIAAVVVLTTAIPEQVPVGGISRVFRKDDGLGNYQFAYNERVGSSGSFRSESGDKSGAKIGTYGVKDDKGNTRVVTYVADENGFRAQVKATDGSDSGTPQSSGKPQAISVTNAKVVEVAPVKYHVKHAPVFHYYAGGARHEAPPVRVRVSLRKSEKGQQKPVETVTLGENGPSYYSADISGEEEVKDDSSRSQINEEGILRKIPPIAAPQYSRQQFNEPLTQAVPSGPSLYSADTGRNSGQHFAPGNGGQPSLYSVDTGRNSGPHIAPGSSVQYASRPHRGVGTPQHLGKALRHQAILLQEDNRNVDVEYNPQVQQPQQRPQYTWSVHPLIKKFELPQLPLLHPHVHYVSNWPNSGQVTNGNGGSSSSSSDDSVENDRQRVIYKYHPILPLPLHYYQDVRKVDTNRPVYHHIGVESLGNRTLRIGETLGNHYTGGWSSSDSSPNYQQHPFAIHKIVKVPVFHSSSYPSSSWSQSGGQTSYQNKKDIEKVGTTYTMGWSNSNQGALSSDSQTPYQEPNDRSWSSVPAWW